MKKIKIMLTAIAAFAVVGGVLAFNVKGTDSIWKKDGNSCPKLQGFFATSTIQEQDYLEVTDATYIDPLGDASKCNKTFYYTIE